MKWLEKNRKTERRESNGKKILIRLNKNNRKIKKPKIIFVSIYFKIINLTLMNSQKNRNKSFFYEEEIDQINREKPSKKFDSI